MSDLVEIDVEERVGIKRRVRDLHESCRIKRRKVLKRVVEAVALAVGWVDDTVATSPSAVDVADPRSDALGGQLGSTRPEVILLTLRLYDLEKERDVATLEHAEL